MITIFIIYFFLLGTIIGSFLNVVIFRHNTGRSTGGRSACMSCKSQLTYLELIPIFSFLFQKGKCKKCKAKISWQYPFVEILTGALFAFNFYYLFLNAVSVSNFIVSIGLSSAILCLMVIIFVYDLKHKIIPDLFSFGAFGLSIVWVVLNFIIPIKNSVISAGSGIQEWIPAFAGMTRGITERGVIIFLINLSAGLIFYLVVYALWKLSKGRLIGLGDAKLLLSIGTLLGIVYGLSSIFISVWIGAIYAIGFLIYQRLVKGKKNITMKSEIPFGPFLIIGFLIVYFLKIDVTNIGFILENFS